MRKRRKIGRIITRVVSSGVGFGKVKVQFIAEFGSLKSMIYTNAWAVSSAKMFNRGELSAVRKEAVTHT